MGYTLDIKFTKYINSLQSHQYQEAMRVIESGTAEEVIELLSNYKIKIKEDTIRLGKIIEVHPDYEKIVNDIYGVSSIGLSSQQRQKVAHFIELETAAEEVIERLSCYKNELSAIELVQNSLYNKVINQKIDKLIEENKIKAIDGWRASKIKDNDFFVAYTWEEENMPEEIGFFFEVNISKNTIQLIEE